MSRDYANKSKPRRNNNRGRKTKKESKSFPILALAFVIMCICAFGYFLWSIKSNTEAVPKTVKITKSKPHKQDELPPKPKEKWEYQNILKNKEVEVDLPKKSNKPTRPYQMQCGSFRKQSQADALKARIAFQGLEAIVSKVSGNSGTWYKVVIGPYPKKRKAEHDRHKLQRGGVNGCQIWFWEGK